MFKNGKLRRAACQDDAARVKMLLDAGADPEKRDNYGDTVAFDAVRMRAADALRVLVAHGVRLDEEVRGGGTLLNMALRVGYTDVAVILIEACPALADMPDKNGTPPVHQAALSGQDKALRALLKCNPALAHAKDRDCETPLHAAAMGGHVEAATLLLETGASATAKNGAGRSPLFVAQKHNRLQIVDILRPLTPGMEVKKPAPGPAEWRKMSGDSIAHVSTEEAIGYRVTEIFNFAARERTVLYQNLETKRETVDTRRFDEIGDGARLEEALAELNKRGGTATAETIGGLGKKRLAP